MPVSAAAPPKAMILAAGRGTRMGELTRSTPKPLLPVGEQPLIVHLLRRLREAGIRQLVINLAWLGERIRAALGDGEAYGVNIDYSPEPLEALGTGGGIRKALPLLGERPFLLVNGDLWTNYPFASLTARTTAAGHLVLVNNPAHNPGGDFGLQADGRIIPGSRYTYAGIALLHPRIFDGQAESFPLGPLLQTLARAGQLSGECFAGVWRDVGTPERLAAANAEARAET